MSYICHYGINNTFKLNINEPIIYEKLYNIIARILNINEKSIPYIIHDNNIVGSKQAPLHYIMSTNSVHIYICITNYDIIIKEPFFEACLIDIKLLNKEEGENKCFCSRKLNDYYHKNVAVLICNHIFHETCIKEYFAICRSDKNRCPICNIIII